MRQRFCNCGCHVKKVMKYLLLIFLLFAMLGCKKSGSVVNDSMDCDVLKQAIEAKDAAMVEQALGNLLEQTYSEENLSAIASDISSDCDMTAKLECFDCIKTNPAQSEMSVSFVVGDPVKRFVLDITPATDNAVKVVSVN
jgi:hypothetical protein